MADLKLIKTKDISRVPRKPNQLIFVDDGSMYFDYSSTVRLHNSGGAHLEDFKAGKEYLKYDMCVYRGLVYRALVDCIDYTFVESHWQLLTLSGGGSGSNQSTDIQYDSTASGLPATTVQQAIDQLAALVSASSENVTAMSVTITELDMKLHEISQVADSASMLANVANVKVDDLSIKVDEHISKAITSDSDVELDTF